MNSTTLKDVIGLRAHIRYRTLKDELDNSSEDLQILRPMGEHNNVRTNTFVKNGINPELACTQVHYLKGHFLLQHLCDMVGMDSFFCLLRKYIHELYHGCLVHSTEFLTLFFNEFMDKLADSKSKNAKTIGKQWLDSKGLPEVLVNEYEITSYGDNKLGEEVIFATRWWQLKNSNYRLSRKRRKGLNCNNTSAVVPMSVKCLFTEQLVLLLENLLEAEYLHPCVINALDEHYCFEKHAPDVQHRFAEIIVKHSHYKKLCFVETFLKLHQAMGIYLYGEMSMSQNKKIRKSVAMIFEEIQSDMDPIMLLNVKEMLYGANCS